MRSQRSLTVDPTRFTTFVGSLSHAFYLRRDARQAGRVSILVAGVVWVARSAPYHEGKEGWAERVQKCAGLLLARLRLRRLPACHSFSALTESHGKKVQSSAELKTSSRDRRGRKMTLTKCRRSSARNSKFQRFASSIPSKHAAHSTAHRTARHETAHTAVRVTQLGLRESARVGVGFVGHCSPFDFPSSPPSSNQSIKVCICSKPAPNNTRTSTAHSRTT